MKKGVLILVLIILVSLFIYLNTSNLFVFNQKNDFPGTGNIITGNATSSGVSISITVTGPPTLNRLKPENGTYFTTINIPLNFTAYSADSIWYKIDSGSNVTITGNTIFNITSGQHTLHLFANNSNGNSSESVVFFVNTTKFNIIYNNYSNNGSSINFNASSFEDIQNLSGIVLERSSHGKVSFNQAINLTNDSTHTDNELDLDSYTNISSNFISINTTALPNFNKSATLSLYGLTFTNPRVLRNREVCPASICTEINYFSGNGTFIFNVTQFSDYSAEETPGEEETPTGGGGGGGSSATTPFVIDRNQITVSLNPGRVKTENITITNTESKPIRIEIQNLLPDFIARGEDVVVLDAGESRAIPLHIIARVDTIPDLHLGKIILSSGSTKKEILVTIEVESGGSLLDARAEILDEYLVVPPGQSILAEVRLFNLGATGRVDVLVEYIIKDYEEKEVIRETESLAIETQTSFVKRIDILENMKEGDYVFFIKVTYNGEIAISSDNFKVALITKEVTVREKIFIVVIIVFAVILSLIAYLVTVHQRTAHGKTPGKGAGEKVDLRKIMRR